jgi:purine-binding chemotaxis protein CheW
MSPLDPPPPHAAGADPAPAAAAAPAARAAAPEPEDDGPAGDVVLVATLCGERVGLPVRCVHEILDPIPATRVPGAPAFAPRIVNVRGAIVPLVELGVRLRMDPAPPGPSERFVVLDLDLEGDGRPVRLALRVDSVEEVADLAGLPVEPLPERAARWPARHLRGVVRRGDDILILPNLDALLDPDAD